MKEKNYKATIMIFLVLSSFISFAQFTIASCNPTDWYECQGSYLNHYYLYGDCTTSSNSQYCSYGCSNGMCNSAPSYTSTYTSTYTGCTPQYTGNYQCSGNELQQQYQNSDCSTTWQNVQYCSNGCFNNNQCASQSTTTTFTTTTTSLIQQCVLHQTGAYQCNGNQQQAQYQYPDCSFQWVTQINCQNGCSNGFCVGSTSTSTSTTTYTSTVTTTYQNYINNYPYPYQVPYNYYYQYYPQYPYYQYPTYTSTYYPAHQCTSGTMNNYECSGNVRQVQYQNSDCSTYWQTVETCQYGCSNGVCLQGQSSATVTTTVTLQPSYNMSGLEAFVLILGVIVVAVFLIRFFASEPKRNPRYEPEYWR